MKQKDKVKIKIPKGLNVTLIVIFALGALGAGMLFGIDAWVRYSVRDQILTEEQAASLRDVDCIVVLGCKVYDDGTPSAMLEDRLRRGVALYDLGAAPKLLMSGDHGRENYDEVDAMKQYAVDAGIPSVDLCETFHSAVDAIREGSRIDPHLLNELKDQAVLKRQETIQQMLLFNLLIPILICQLLTLIDRFD